MDSEVQLKERWKKCDKMLTYIHTLCFLLETQWDNPLPAILGCVSPLAFIGGVLIKNTLSSFFARKHGCEKKI